MSRSTSFPHRGLLGRLSWVLLLPLLVASPVSLLAGSYLQGFTFANGTLPGSALWNDGATLLTPSAGTPPAPVASVQANAFRLTQDGVMGTTSALQFPDIDPGQDIVNLTIDFQLKMTATGTPGNGFSINFGDIPTDTDGDGEIGYALKEGLVVSFKTLVDSAAGRTNGEISVYSDRVLIASVPQTFAYDTTLRKVTLHWDAQGLDVAYSGTNVIENLALPGFVAHIGDRTALSARTGTAASQEITIDNFSIKTLNAPVIPTGGPVILEFVADNQGSYEDEDVDTSDWIELYNGGAATSLDGWFLTNDQNVPKKWAFPALPFGTNKYVIVYASGKDRSLTNGQLHANFTLQKSGGYLALVRPDGSLASEFNYGPQKPDIAYGEVGVSRTVGYLETPTPGRKNVSLVADGPPAESVLFSRPGGVFMGPNPLVVAITTPKAPGSVVRYTLNNTIPSASSPAYTAPFSLTNTTTIRARVFTPGLLPGSVSSRTFLSMDPTMANFAGTGKPFSSSLPILVADSFGVAVDSSGRNAGSSVIGAFWPAYAVMFDTDPATGHSSIAGAPDFEGRSGFHVRGESSAGFDQHSYAWETWDNNNADKAVSILGMPAESDWILHGPWSDKTLMRNYIAYSTMNEARTEYFGERTRFVEVFFNQERGQPVSYADYRGVYLLVEKIKRAKGRVNIAKLNSLVTDTNLITGGYIFRKDKDNAKAYNWTSSHGIPLQGLEPAPFNAAQQTYLKNYVDGFEKALYSPNFNDPVKGYPAWIDVPSFVDAQLWVELTKQVDGYVFSTYFFKDRGAKWKAGPTWDFNISLGNADYATGDTPTGWLYANSLTDPLGLAAGIWYPDLLKDPEYRLAFWDRYFELRNAQWNTGSMMARIDAVKGLMLDGVTQPISNNLPLTVQAPAARQYKKYQRLGIRDWPNPPEATVRFTFQSEVDAMKQWISTRLAWMDDQDTLGFAVYRPPVFSLPGGLVDKGTLLSIAPYSGPAPAGKSYPAGTVYYTTDGTDPRPPGFGAPVPTDIPVVPEYSLASYHIPTAGNGGAAATIADWTGPVLGPTAAGLPWLTGRLALGFDDNTSSNYVHIGGGDYAQGDIRAGMLGVSSTVFIRIPFTLDATQMQRLTAMTLKMRQDDAFIAFLNGVEIGRYNVNVTNAPLYDMVANKLPAGWKDTLAAQQHSFVVSNVLARVHEGNNMLAVIGINASATDDDAMFSPTLVGTFLIPPSAPVTSTPYAGPIAITGNTVVKARLFYNGFWSPPTSASFVVGAYPATPENLVISEFMYSPAAPTAAEIPVSKSAGDYEYIEFFNTSTQPVDLTGVRITNGVQFAFSSGDPASIVLAGGSRVVVCANLAAFRARYGNTPRVAGVYSGSLNNSGETITVIDGQGRILSNFTYSNTSPWPEGADGTGYSLVLNNPASHPAPDPSDPANWRCGGTRNGRPGLEDSVPLTLAPYEDPDADGLPNLLEYAIGSNPLLPSSRTVLTAAVSELTVLGATGSYVTFEYRRNLNADGIALHLQTSSDLSNWSNVSGELEYVGMRGNGDGTATVTWRTAKPLSDQDLASLFVRLAVQQ